MSMLWWFDVLTGQGQPLLLLLGLARPSRYFAATLRYRLGLQDKVGHFAVTLRLGCSLMRCW
jgi:hypothetical protein